jgi:hypothetical protein
MSDVQAEASHLEVIFHDDDETPVDFVIDLLHSVFKKQIADDQIYRGRQATRTGKLRHLSARCRREAAQSGSESRPCHGDTTPDHQQGGPGGR